jgi:glutamate carboxypeptidase
MTERPLAPNFHFQHPNATFIDGPNESVISMKKLLIILTLSTVCLNAFSQTLRKEEQKLVRTVDQHMTECIALLEQVVNINSGTMNPEGVKKVGTSMKAEFDKLGMETRWIDMPPEMKRGGHLIAESKGKKGKRLLLIGHLDTVFEPYSDFQKFERKDSIAHGPGTNDMKGGNLVILYALRALHDAGLLKNTQIIVIMHGDEENSGDPESISRKDIIEAAKRSDVALAFETGTGFDVATVARRGSSSWQLDITGKQAHSAGVFTANVGAGAIYEAARILDRFYKELPEQYLTFNAGLIAGGTILEKDSSGTELKTSGKTNIVPNTAFVKGDLRFISQQQLTAARKKMSAIVSESLPQTQSRITFFDGIPSMPPTEGNMKLLEVYSKVSIDLGLGAVKPYDPGRRGAGDISYVAEYLDCLDGIGAMGGGAHAPTEFINLNTFDEQIKRAALTIYRLTR